MSTDSPFSFHVVGGPGEPVHYELHDTSGRVVCKALWDGADIAVFAGGMLSGFSRERHYSVSDVEFFMRAAVSA